MVSSIVFCKRFRSNCDRWKSHENRIEYLSKYCPGVETNPQQVSQLTVFPITQRTKFNLC